jgi:hypothetical protein
VEKSLGRAGTILDGLSPVPDSKESYAALKGPLFHA